MQSAQAVIKQGDTYWCDPDPQLVDTVGSEQTGEHIWLIVSIKSRGKCVVALPLSRHTEKATVPFLITIPASEITYVDGSPALDRVALTDQIRCLNKTRLGKQSGAISSRALRSVFIGLDNLFGRYYPNPKAN